MAHFDYESRNTLECIQCWKHFCCKKAIILAYIEVRKFGIEILKTNRKSEILPTIMALLKKIFDVVHFCAKENSCISAAVPSAKFIMITWPDWLQRSGWTIRRASAEHESIFLRRGRSTTFQLHQKNPATCGCNPAGSKIENGIFSRREANHAELLLVQLVAAGWTETIKNKSHKRKESPVEGSQGEAADRKHQKTGSGSTKAKYFAFLNEESSCSADNSSQSEDPYVKAKLMMATKLNEPKCKHNVCPLQVQMGQCQRYPDIAAIAWKYLSTPVSSVASEREFKVARANGSRTLLKSDNVEKVLFLKQLESNWLWLDNFVWYKIDYVKLPCLVCKKWKWHFLLWLRWVEEK